MAVIKLSEIEAQNPKVTSEEGALLAILDSVAHDAKIAHKLPGRKSDNLLQALVNEFPPDHVWRKRKSRFSESDSYNIDKYNTVENPFMDLDVEFHPKYIECPVFKSCRGVILYKEAFKMVLNENEELREVLNSFSDKKDVKNIESISDAIAKIKVPSILIREVSSALEKILTGIKDAEYYFIVNLLNGNHPLCLESDSTEKIVENIKTAWITYFRNIQFDKIIRLPMEYFIPAISIQIVNKPRDADSKPKTGVFSRLHLNDDPRNFLIHYGKSQISSLISLKLSDFPQLNRAVVTRNYNYSSYKLSHETIRDSTSVLTDEQIISIARLGATLEKMLAVELKIFWILIDDQIHIIHARNITDNSLTMWELKNEFDSAEMSFELKEAAKDFTPLTISSLVSLMSQSQQIIFNNVVTGGLYRIGKIIRRLGDNNNTSVTIRRFLGINGNDALKHLYLNAIISRYEMEYARKFFESAVTRCHKEKLKRLTKKEIFATITDVLNESHELWDYYYNLIAVQRSWLYLIFKFICGTSEGMKAEHFEDFAIVTQYFNVRDLSIQKFVQSCKRISDDFLEVPLSEMNDDEIVNLFHTIVDGNPALHKPYTIELMADDRSSLNWSKQLNFAFDSYAKIKNSNLNSTFNLRFPQEKKRIDHILNHLVSAHTGFDKLCMKIMLIRLRNVTRKLLEANSMREKFIKIIQDSYRILSSKCHTEDIYYMTQPELQMFIDKNRYEYLERAHERHAVFSSKHKSEKPSNVIQDTKVYGNCICPGTAVGFALVADGPSKDLITEDVPPIILITNNLRKNVGWLPYLRLFKGIVLETDGYFDADAAVCRLVGVPAIIGAKDVMSMFKTGDNLLLNGTKGLVSKLTEN
uniref:CSON005496 protein n=1 Tax=Culicoides sonorensis TaxID=179676 RepID=A0A336MQL3_CULSO